jgi:hypothetical protein
VTDAQLHQDLGYLRAKVEALEDVVEHVRSVQSVQGEKIAAIHDVLMQAKGGWRAMVMVGSVSAAVGAVAAKAIALIPWR